MVSKRNFLFKRVPFFQVPGLNLGRVCGGLPTNRNYESLIGMHVNPQKYYDLFLLLVWLVFQKILDILKLSMSREDQTIKSKTFLCHMPSLLKWVDESFHERPPTQNKCTCKHYLKNIYQLISFLFFSTWVERHIFGLFSQQNFLLGPKGMSRHPEAHRLYRETADEVRWSGRWGRGEGRMKPYTTQGRNRWHMVPQKVG